MAGAVKDKVLWPLGGLPLFSHSAGAFAQSGVADLYVIVHRDQRQMLELAALAPTPTLFVPGGTERQYSVAHALDALPADISHVFIHDCARPFVRPEHLVALLKIVLKESAVVLAHREPRLFRGGVALDDPGGKGFRRKFDDTANKAIAADDPGQRVVVHAVLQGHKNPVRCQMGHCHFGQPAVIV